MDVLATLEVFFRQEAPLAAGDGVVVAFSGGPDSTALLWGMSRLAARWELRLHAAHLDHAMDRGSAGRAAESLRLAGELGVPLTIERCDVLGRRPAESAEAAGRRARYEFLERTRQRLGARFVATAHHRDDQAETVLLRLLFGSGLEGLAGIRPVHGAVVRPLLSLSRAALSAAVTAAGLAPVADPNNRDLGVPRNRVRHRLLPALAAGDADLAPRLAWLADRARAAGLALDRRLAGRLKALAAAGGMAVERQELERLPDELRPYAFSWLHRQAGAPYPAGGAARGELFRQLAERPHAACDCGGGWRWEATDNLLVLRRDDGARETIPDFTYTLEIPGELHIPEIAVRVRVYRCAVEPWMFQGSPRRAGLALPLTEGDRVTIRNRRPGDRIHPLGARGSRRLKAVLIDRRVPPPERRRLPLLCVGERIAWAPGVAIDDRFRLEGHATAWVAEVATT
ncbi:MAG TPA: tRNA lysidine(34) synthetase TilS [Thermoanaerobaculia bacterium]|jgi:tRNA(Ile)-lysidine synthase|nr:tRNA lysidine(34) synthetase TilS [Thermoanaerobaculia bacterium]